MVRPARPIVRAYTGRAIRIAPHRSSLRRKAPFSRTEGSSLQRDSYPSRLLQQKNGQKHAECRDERQSLNSPHFCHPVCPICLNTILFYHNLHRMSTNKCATNGRRLPFAYAPHCGSPYCDRKDSFFCVSGAVFTDSARKAGAVCKGDKSDNENSDPVIVYGIMAVI